METTHNIIPFTKMHGAGNDYIYVNTIEHPIADPERLAILWSDRHKGIGSDGLVLIGLSQTGDFSMRIFNNDGSEARMCGNASRCIGRYLYEKGLTRLTTIRLETLSGIKVLHLNLDDTGETVETVTVDMGRPILANRQQILTPDGSLCDAAVRDTKGREVTGTFVSMGNPHFVVFVDDVESLDITERGRALEQAAIFPERCNIEFATVRSDGSIRMRVWERGSGVTMACGTGACATAVAAALTHRTGRSSEIVMDGGSLCIEWYDHEISCNSTEKRFTDHIYMTGEAITVYEGCIEIPPATLANEKSGV